MQASVKISVILLIIAQLTPSLPPTMFQFAYFSLVDFIVLKKEYIFIVDRNSKYRLVKESEIKISYYLITQEILAVVAFCGISMYIINLRSY